jgi:hypothetical protein
LETYDAPSVLEKLRPVKKLGKQTIFQQKIYWR